MILLTFGSGLITLGLMSLTYLSHMDTADPHTIYVAYGVLAAVTLGTTLVISHIIKK